MSERWKICEHARERMEQMGLSRRDVLGALVHPEVDCPASAAHPGGRRIARAGRLVVVYHAAKRIVVTILWRGREFMARDRGA